MKNICMGMEKRMQFALLGGTGSERGFNLLKAEDTAKEISCRKMVLALRILKS